MQATASPAEFRPAPGWRRGGLAVLALHLALLGLWRQALHRAEVTAPPAAQAPLVWLSVPAAPLPTAPAAPVRRTGPPPAAPMARTPPLGPAVVPPGTLQLLPASGDGAVPAPPVPSTPASAPSPQLLDSEATRAAIREAARQPLLSERAAAATGIAPRTDAQHLSEGVGQAAKSDCLRDPSAAGLLALPWLAARAISGDCPR